MLPLAIFGASALGTLGSIFGQKKANETSVDLAEAQMKFQDQMSRTQYQRAVKDLKAAGLNPILAALNGGNASMSGAMPSVKNIAEGVDQSLAQSILSSAKAKADIALTNELKATEKTKQAVNKAATDIAKEDLSSAKLRSLQAQNEYRFEDTPLGKYGYSAARYGLKILGSFLRGFPAFGK